MSCLPTYKGKRYQSLSEIAQVTKDEWQADYDAKKAEKAKISSPDIQMPDTNLGKYDIQSDAYKDVQNYQSFEDTNKTGNDFLTNYFNDPTEKDTIKLLEKHTQVVGEGFDKAKDGDVAIFTDEQGNMASYGQIVIDEQSKKKYYVTYDLTTGKHSTINLEQAQKAFPKGYTAIRKDAPAEPVKRVTAEQWQAMIKSSRENDSKIDGWISAGFPVDDQAQKSIRDTQLMEEGIAVDPENPSTYVPSDKWWWFKSGFNSSIIGKAYQLLSWHNIKTHLLSDFANSKNPNPPQTEEEIRNYALAFAQKEPEKGGIKEVRPPVFDLHEYDPSMIEEIVAGATAILVDTPLFLTYGKMGARGGAALSEKAVEYMSKRNLIKYSQKTIDELVAKGINKELATRYVLNGINKFKAKAAGYGSRFGSSIGALALYDYTNDVLNQVVASDGEFAEVDYGHSLKEGLIGGTLGMGLGFLGMGNQAIANALTREGATAVEKTAIKVGTGAVTLPVEAGLFVFGRRGLTGQPLLDDDVAREYGTMLGTLVLIKGQGLAQEKGKKYISQSKDFVASKMNLGKYKIQFDPTEIEYLNRKKFYGKTTEEVINNLIKTHGKFTGEEKRLSSLEISDIMADPEIPFTLKKKIVWSLGGYQMKFDPVITNVNLRSENGTYYVELRNKSGDLMLVSATKDAEAANTQVQNTSLRLIDNQKQNQFAELTEMEKALILSQLKTEGMEPGMVREAWDTELFSRTPDQQKYMDRLYKETESFIKEKQRAKAKAEKIANQVPTEKVPVGKQTFEKTKESDIKPELDEKITEQQTRLKLPTDPLQSMPEEIGINLKRAEGNLPGDPVSVKQSSDFLYEEYKRLEQLKGIDTRRFTLQQINDAQALLEKQITQLEEYRTSLTEGFTPVEEAVNKPPKTIEKPIPTSQPVMKEEMPVQPEKPKTDTEQAIDEIKSAITEGDIQKANRIYYQYRTILSPDDVTAIEKETGVDIRKPEVKKETEVNTPKNNGDVVKELYTEWSNIKDNAGHEAWAEKVKGTKFGTYQNMDVLNVMDNFDIPFKNKNDRQQFITELEEALNVPKDKRTFKPKEVEIEPEPVKTAHEDVKTEFTWRSFINYNQTQDIPARYQNMFPEELSQELGKQQTIAGGSMRSSSEKREAREKIDQIKKLLKAHQSLIEYKELLKTAPLVEKYQAITQLDKGLKGREDLGRVINSTTDINELNGLLNHIKETDPNILKTMKIYDQSLEQNIYARIQYLQRHPEKQTNIQKPTEPKPTETKVSDKPLLDESPDIVIGEVMAQTKWQHPHNKLSNELVMELLKLKGKEKISLASEELEDLGYVKQKDLPGNDVEFELTDKGRELIQAVESRMETIKGLNAGHDLFPQDADMNVLLANQKAVAFHKKYRQEIRGFNDSNKITDKTGVNMTTGTYREGTSTRVKGYWNEFDFGEYELLTTNKPERFSGEFVMADSEKIDQTKPVYAIYFGDFNGSIGWERATLSNDLQRAIDIARDFDARDAFLEVYDPESKMMVGMEIYPFENKYTEQSVRGPIVDELITRKEQADKYREEAKEEIVQERKEFEESVVPKEERPEPIEIAKEEIKAPEISEEVINERMKAYEEFVTGKGFAIRTGERKGSMRSGYYATPGMSTYYDLYSENPDASFYDISFIETIESGSPQAKKLLTEALKSLKERNKDNVYDKDIKLIEDALNNDALIDYHLLDGVYEVGAMAQKMGYDAIKVWENDDVGGPSSLFIYNGNNVNNMGRVIDVRKTFLDGLQWKDPTLEDVPIAEEIETPPTKATKPKAYKPLDEKGQKKVMKIVANGKSTLPILDYVHIENGVARVYDLDNDVQFKTSLPNGIYRFVGEDLVPDKISMDEFPVYPEIGKMKAKADISGIKGDIINAGRFVGNDEIRPVMSAVQIKSDGKNITIASTDAHQLYSKTLPIKAPEFEILLPSKAIKILKSNPAEEPLSIENYDNHVVIKTGDYTLTARKIDGKYPAWQAVVPEETFVQMTVNRAELIAAINKLIPYANKKNKKADIYFDTDTGEIIIKAEDVEMGHEKAIRLKTSAVETGVFRPGETNDFRLQMPIMRSDHFSTSNDFRNVTTMNILFLKNIAESYSGETISIHSSNRAQAVSKDRALLFTEGKVQKRKSGTEVPEAEPKQSISPEQTKSIMDDFSRNFTSSENVSDVVGGKEATKFVKVNGFSMILDPGKNGLTIESIWTPPEARRKGMAKRYMGELIKLADKNNVPLILRAVPEVVEGKEVIPKENLKRFYEKLGFVFQGDKGVRLPNIENKPRTEAKNTKGRKGLFAAEGEIMPTGSSEKGKNQPGDNQPKETEAKKITMEDAEIIIPEHWSKDVKPEEVFKAIDFPEIVDIVHKMIGRYPQPRNMRRPGLLGYFRHSNTEGMIALKRALFHEANYDMLKYVLAHEVGHLNDWMPDKDMRRGNILGRISSGREHLKTTLGEKPGKDNILTKEDRDRLQKEAKKEVREQSKKTEQQIIQEIIKEIPVYDEAGMSANDIAAIWRDVNAREKYPELYEYVARLSAEQKKQIMKEAIKGIVNSEIAAKFKKQIGTEKVSEQIIKMIRPLANTKENIAKMYKKLLMEEINKRRLFDKETITKELIGVTSEWRRYDPATASREEKAYRESSEELYADAFAMLMNNPEKLQKMAPVFYNAFFNWWDAKSGSKAYFDEIQNILNGGDGSGRVPGLGENMNDSPLDQRRLDNIIDGYKEGEQKRMDIANEKEGKRLGFFSRFRYEFLSNREALLNKIKRDTPKKLQMNLDDQQAIDNATQMLLFTRDKLGEILTDINQIIEVPLEKAGLSPYEFAALLELEKNLSEQYENKARPLGMQTDASRQLKSYIYSRYTPEQTAAMVRIIQEFHDKVYQIMDYANQNGLFTADQWKMITDNKDIYATYSKVKYIHENYMSSKIFEAEGSLEKNENPFIATVFKLASTYKAAERNRAAKAVVNDMLKFAPDEIVVRDPIRMEGGRPVGWKIPEKGKDYIHFIENGHMKGAEVDQYIADVFNTPDARHKFESFVNIIRQYNHVFKPMVTSLNVGWAFYNNPSRDARRSMRNLFTILYSTEGVSKRKAFSVVPKFIAGYAQQVNPLNKNTTAKNYVRNTLDSSVREMIDNGAITRGFFGSYDPYISDQLEPLFKSHGYIRKEKSLMDKMKEKTYFTRQLAKAVDGMLFMSSVIEATPKIVGYNILKEAMKNEMSAAYYTRNYVGTPFYYEKGRKTYWSNEIFPFSNVILQGMAADIRLASSPKTRYAYHMYQIMNTSSVALITAGASAGLFGDDLKRLFGKIDDYIKYNYYVIPIKETEKGRPVYITIPMDEFGRLNYSTTYSLATTFFKAYNHELKGFDQWWDQFNQVKKIGTGMVPSFSPLAEIANGISSYLNDQNFKDSFTNKDVIPKKAFDAGKIESAPYVGKWMVEKSGGRWAVKLLERKKGEDTGTEYVLKNIPVLSRALRIGGTGEYIKYKEAAAPLSRQRAQDLLRMDRAINDAIIDAKTNNKESLITDYLDQIISDYFGEKGYDPTNEQHVKDMKSIKTKFNTRSMRGFSTPADQLVSAVIDFGQSKDQQIAILKKGIEGFTNDEYNEIIINLRMNGIISKEVAMEVFMAANPDMVSDYEKLIENMLDKD